MIAHNDPLIKLGFTHYKYKTYHKEATNNCTERTLCKKDWRELIKRARLANSVAPTGLNLADCDIIVTNLIKGLGDKYDKLPPEELYKIWEHL